MGSQCFRGHSSRLARGWPWWQLHKGVNVLNATELPT